MTKTLEDVLKAASKKAASSGFNKTVKPQPGRSVWRIMPGWDKANPNQFFHAYGQHFIKDFSGQLKVVIGCPDKTFDEPCEICDAISDAARNASDDKTREKILESRSTQRFLLNAINVEADASKVEILEIGAGLFRDILANISEDETLIDPEEGRDFVITREGTGLNTRYSLAVRSKSKSANIPASALMSLNDLTAHVTEDFETKKRKALTAIGAAFGTVVKGSTTAGLLEKDDLDDDEIPEFSDDDLKREAAAEIEEAEVEYPEDSKVEDKKAEESFGEDVSEEDIEAMLAGLD